MSEDTKMRLESCITEIEELVDECEMKDGSMNTYIPLPKELKKEYKEIESMQKQKTILYNGSLMLLITYYENLIAGLFREDFIKYPDRIHLDSKSVTYKILEEFNDIAEIKRHLVDEEVVSMMYKSHEDWVKYFTDKMKLELIYINENITTITEIIARRNLLVHNNGKVNSIYINLTGNKEIKKGATISVTQEYIQYAIDVIEIAGFSLVTEMWLKNSKGDEDEVGKLDSIMYSECLEGENWLLGRYLYAMCCKDKKISEAERLMFKINMWQCEKRLGEFEKVKADIEMLDLSAALPRYRLAVLALLENEKEFFEVFDKQSDIDEETLKEWPIFRDIREGEEFQYRYGNIDVEEGV